MRTHQETASDAAFTLIELLVVIAVVAVIAALLLPVFVSVREKAQRTTCLSNLRQVGLAVASYSQDHEGFFPPVTIGPADKEEGDWATAVFRYAGTKEVFRCPACPVPEIYDEDVPGLPVYTAKGYAMSGALFDYDNTDNPAVNTAQVRFPASTVVICEVAYYLDTDGNPSFSSGGLSGPDDDTTLLPGTSFIGTAGALRHQGGSNYLFADGHTRWYRPGEVSHENQGNTGTRPSFAL